MKFPKGHLNSLNTLYCTPFNIFSAVKYDISATLASHGSAGTTNDVCVQIVGTTGYTEEVMCPSSTFNTNSGTTVTCTVTSTAELGNYTCVTWRLDGSDGLNIAEFTTSIDSVTQTTIAPADGWLDDAEDYGQTATWCIGKHRIYR